MSADVVPIFSPDILRLNADIAQCPTPPMPDRPADPITADDPLWYKDAIIYQLHVKALSRQQRRRLRRFSRA